MGKDMDNDEQMSDMVTAREVTPLLRIPPDTMRRWSSDGRIRPYRITPLGDRRFKREEIANFLAALDAQLADREESREQTVVMVVKEGALQ